MRASRSDPRSSGAVFFAVFFAAAIVLGGPATSARAAGVGARGPGMTGPAAPMQPVSEVLDGSTRPAARTPTADADGPGRALVASDVARLEGGLDGEGPLGRLSRPSLRLIVGVPLAVPSGVDRSHARAAELSRLSYASNLVEAQAGELAARSTAPPAHLI